MQEKLEKYNFILKDGKNHFSKFGVVSLHSQNRLATMKLVEYHRNKLNCFRKRTHMFYEQKVDLAQGDSFKFLGNWNSKISIGTTEV